MSQQPSNLGNPNMPSLSAQDLQNLRRLVVQAAGELGREVGFAFGTRAANSFFDAISPQVAGNGPVVSQLAHTNTVPIGSNNSSSIQPNHVPTSSTKKPVQPSPPASLQPLLPDFFWVDGDLTQEISSADMHKGKPHLGWAFMQHATKHYTKEGVRYTRKYFYCLGAFKCNHCEFTVRPQKPNPRRVGMTPSSPKERCPLHATSALQWMPCRGNPFSPCSLLLDVFSNKLILTHNGTHNHPKPPVKKPAPRSLDFLQKTVLANPKLEPVQLHIGVQGRSPLPQLDPAFNNVDVIGHHRRNFLANNPKSNLSGHGVRTTTGALMQLLKDLPEGVVKDSHISKECHVFTIQTEGQEWLVNNTPCGLVSDTVHGIINDHDFEGELFVHFTSAFDPILGKWIPVLSSVIAGLTKIAYARHWSVLLDSVELDDPTSWDEFEGKFPGVTLDWSDAEAESLGDVLVAKAKGKLTTNQAKTFVQKCEVHFQRSVSRILRNGRVVGDDNKQRRFKELVREMISSTATANDFIHACQSIIKEFKHAIPWLMWHINPKRSKSFFPACQLDFSDNEKQRLAMLEKTTNAEENVGRQFKRTWEVSNRKLSFNEALLNAWRWSNRDDMSRQEALMGAKPAWGSFNRGLDPKARKKRKFTNDGRAPDSNATLFKAKKKPAAKPSFPQGANPPTSAPPPLNQQGIVGCDWRFFSSQGAEITATCPLDTLLTMLAAPVWAQAMVQNVFEGADPSSLLARTWVLMCQDRWNDARELWIAEWLERDTSQFISLFTSMDRMFVPDARSSKKSPLFQWCTVHYGHTTVCCNPDKCQGAILCAHVNSDGEEFSDDGKRVVMKNLTRMLHMVPGGREVSLRGGWTRNRSPTVTFPKALDLIYGEEMLPKHCVRAPCDGPSYRHACDVTKWPSLMWFDCPGYTLEELPFTFHWRNKKFVLRAVALNNQIHFVGAFRMPNGWMIYDGRDQIKFSFFPLDKATEARGNYIPSMSVFEVMDESVEENFKNPDFDWRTTFRGKEEHGFGQKNDPIKKNTTKQNKNEQGKVDAFLKQLLKQANAARKEAKSNEKGHKKKTSQPPPDKRDQRVSRTPNGWSYSTKKPRTGPLATCKGCKKAIKRDDERIKHKAILKNNEHPTICFFHLKVACVKKAGSPYVDQFLNKKWTNIKVRDVQFQLEKDDNSE